MNELLKSLAAAIGGGALWQFYLHLRGRTFQKRLLIDIETSCKPLAAQRILFVEVKLTNTGKIKLAAKPVSEKEFVYKDQIEQLKYSCSLQIRLVEEQGLTGATVLDWYRCPALKSVEGIPQEINLLDEYAVPDEDYRTVFWMEPGDIAHLAAPVVLNPGHYILKVSFYGTNIERDFWSRLVQVQVE